MSYALNSPYGTRRITLSSSGLYSGPNYNPTFRFNRDITLNEALMNIVSLEFMSFKHPTYFHEEYMTGYIEQTAAGVNLMYNVTKENFDPSSYIRNLYVSNADATVTPYIALDGILYYILLFLKTAIQDDTAALNYNFYDRNDNTNYEYNNKVRLDLATMGPFDDATFTNMFNHQATIQHLILQRNCEL